MDERRQEPDRRAEDRGGRAGEDPPDWLSVTDYAHSYGVDRSTVYKWLKLNLLEIYRVGTLLRIRNLPPNERSASADVEER